MSVGCRHLGDLGCPTASAGDELRLHHGVEESTAVVVGVGQSVDAGAVAEPDGLGLVVGRVLVTDHGEHVLRDGVVVAVAAEHVLALATVVGLHRLEPVGFEGALVVVCHQDRSSRCHAL